MVNKYPRGSEWRKWDLQVQTILDDGYVSIGSYFDDLKRLYPEKCKILTDLIGSEELIKKFDSKDYFFSDTTENEATRIKNYSKLFLNYIDIFNEDIGAICITDHNYDHTSLIDSLLKESEHTKVKVIPGVEINIQGVHCLILFGNTSYGKQNYSETIKTFLTKINVTSKKTGGVLTVCDKSYTDVIGEIKKVGAILIYPHCNSSNGLFQERGSTDRTHLADFFNFQKVNILQSQNLNSANTTTTYIATNNNLKSKFVFTLGSDARSLKDIFGADESENYCWIKADPTFEGLKQIIFEPDERVKIQTLKPDKKDVYRVITEVKINDENFSSNPIPINNNLTVIIGSRSSGKTTLLNSIAKSIDPSGFELRFINSKLLREPPLSSIKWEDGAVVPSETINKGITYIPQNYIINLTEATDGQAPILEIAEKAIFDNEDSISSQKNQLDGQIEEIGISLASEIFRLFTVKNQIITQKEKIKQIGDKAGINEQIKLLDQLIKTLQKNFTPQEREILSDLVKQYTENKEKKDILSGDIELITSEISRPPVPTDIFHDRNINFRSTSLLEELSKFEDENKALYLTKYLEFLETKKKQLISAKTLLEKANENLLDSNKELIARSKENKTAQDKIKEKQEQENKLAEIIKEETNLEKLETQFIEIKENILQAQKQRTQLRNDFTELASGIIDGIEYKAVLEIDKSKFCKYLDDSINFHNSVSCRDELNAIPGYKNNESYEPTALIEGENIKNFLDLILNDKLKTKTGVSIQDAVEGLFADFEFINYSLSYEGDSYPEMTPGKKSLVVLKLLIESSKDKFPILIDQPEDDLDSRSISHEIVNFLIQKKKERQIILVTHNANIAIKADAEEIVVVNRHGTESKNANDVMFDYLTGAIEYSFVDYSKENILERMGTREQACDLLEGGKEAFENRRNKFNIKQ